MPINRLKLVLFIVIVFFLCCFAGLGCGRSLERTVIREKAPLAKSSTAGSVKMTKQNLSMAKSLKDVPSAEYVLGPGDKVSISVYRYGGLSMQDRISPAGRISYYMLGEIEAAGLTRFQLKDKIQKGLARFFKEPEVVVQVSDFRSHKIIVLGEVKKPGVFYMVSDFSLLEAISSAGGVTPTAYLKGAYLVRDEKILLINFYELIKKGNTEENIPLLAGDVIYIPDNRDQKVFVLGEVNRQSAVAMRGKMTLFGAIAVAGGFTRDARKESIVVMRGNLSEPEILLINAEDMTLEANVLLKQGDIIYVASTTFANVERVAVRLSHILNPFLDVARGVLYQDAAIGVLTEGKESKFVTED